MSGLAVSPGAWTGIDGIRRATELAESPPTNLSLSSGRRQRGLDCASVLLLDLRQRRPVLAWPRNASKARFSPKAGIALARSSHGEQQHVSSSVGPEQAGQVFKALRAHLGNLERSSKGDKYANDSLCKAFPSREVVYVRTVYVMNFLVGGAQEENPYIRIPWKSTVGFKKP